MLLKKSFMVGAGKFSALLARPARGEVRDDIDSPESDH
jgi:hypothetical protein